MGFQSTEIRELRLAGRLDEALSLALKIQKDYEKFLEEYQSILAADFKEKIGIWAYRNLAHVYHDRIQASMKENDLEKVFQNLTEFTALNLPAVESGIYNRFASLLGGVFFRLSQQTELAEKWALPLFELQKNYPYPKPSASYSYLLRAVLKCFHEKEKSAEILEWWNPDHFYESDFLKRKLPDGKIIPAPAFSILKNCYLNWATLWKEHRGIPNREEEFLRLDKKIEKIISSVQELKNLEKSRSEFLALLPSPEAKKRLMAIIKQALPAAWVQELLLKARPELSKDREDFSKLQIEGQIAELDFWKSDLAWNAELKISRAVVEFVKGKRRIARVSFPDQPDEHPSFFPYRRHFNNLKQGNLIELVYQGRENNGLLKVKKGRFLPVHENR